MLQNACTNSTPEYITAWLVIRQYKRGIKRKQGNQVTWHVFKTHPNQEIIKVREWIPHIGPLTKVIRLKLFLDIVPSSSEAITRAMRGQPKRLSRNYLRRNGGNVISYVLVSFHTGDVFCTLSRLFVQSGISFVFLRVGLYIILPFIHTI